MSGQTGGVAGAGETRRLEEKVREYQELFAQAEAQIGQLKARVQELEAIADKPKSAELLEVAAMKGKVGALEAALEEKSLELSEAKAEVASLRLKLEEAEAEVVRLRGELAKKDAALKRLEEEGVKSGGTSGRRVCPRCGSAFVVEREDRSRVLTYVPKTVYGRKFACRNCGHEWT
ncbi:MAG: hypothetical protein ACTSU5_13830 [Promethearchaeota archaeon]